MMSDDLDLSELSDDYLPLVCLKKPINVYTQEIICAMFSSSIIFPQLLVASPTTSNGITLPQQ